MFCAINIDGHECGQPVAGAIHWRGEDFIDEACLDHLAVFADDSEIEIYPTCEVEVLDRYSRVDLVLCGVLATTALPSVGWVCSNHLTMLAEAN
jgi:hypothetical protein